MAAIVVQLSEHVTELDVAHEAHIGVSPPRVTDARPKAVRVVDRLRKARVVRTPRARARREGIANVEQDRPVARVRPQRVTELAVCRGWVELHLRAAAEVDLD